MTLALHGYLIIIRQITVQITTCTILARSTDAASTALITNNRIFMI